MNINIQEVQKSLCALMCADVKLIKRNGRIVVKTPFSFPDGDPYLIYMTEQPGGAIRLSDAGHTMMHLSYENDVDKFRQGTRGKLFDLVLNQNGVTNEDGELFVDTPPNKIGSAIFKFGQTITSIGDLTFLNRVRAESTFYEDLAETLSRIVEPEKITRDYVYPDIENAGDYPIDYKIEGQAAPLFLFGIPGRDKAMLVTIVLERLLRANADFDSMLVFHDQSTIPRTDLARLSNAGGEMISSLDAQDDMKRKISRKTNV